MTPPPQDRDQDPAPTEQDGPQDRTEQAAAAGHVPGPGALGPPEDLPRPGPGEGSADEEPESEGQRQSVETVRSISRLEESN